jgi:signal peptidase II
MKAYPGRNRMEFIIIIVGLVLDRITKIWAGGFLMKVQEIVIIKDIFSFSYLENRGAAFGIFQNKVMILSFITILVILGMIFYLVKYRPASKLLKTSIALIISGALGNLFDRLYYKYVVDFIMFHYKDAYYFPTFNVADMMVVIGTALLVLYLLKEDKNNGKVGV